MGRVLVWASVGLCLASCGEAESASEQAKKLPSLDAIQTLATRQCECRMAGYDAIAIRREIERLVDGLNAEGFGTSSDPISYSSTCFPDLGERACVLSDAILVSEPDQFVCTVEQGEEVEASWNDALDGPYGATAAADKAARQKIEELRIELRASLDHSVCN